MPKSPDEEEGVSLALYQLEKEGKLTPELREALLQSPEERERELRTWLRWYRAAAWIRRHLLRR